MKASFTKYTLHFKRPGGTSRGVLTDKETYFICLRDGQRWGVGETGLFRGLSADDRSDYETVLAQACKALTDKGDIALEAYREFPSIVFGLEQALRSLNGKSPFNLFPSSFLEGEPIPINGLIWMGDPDFMKQQIREKTEMGFRCLKMKIGALDFGQELNLLRDIRSEYPADQLEIRVDANGAFTEAEALEKLKLLSELELHSIEQPIAPGLWEAMAKLCEQTPLPIALDEELIGIFRIGEKRRMLEAIRPQYIILKPSLVGGFSGSMEWIEAAESRQIGWWVTSALESNIGLNAIAQWTATLGVHLPQGLGTGSLFTNNFESPLEVVGGALHYRQTIRWNETQIEGLCI
jgi:O-succinylbenzoate synthase